MSGAFYAIVDEDEGIFLVYKDTMTVELLRLQDIEVVAAKFNVSMGASGADALYEVAAKLATGFDFSPSLAAFRDGGLPFLACLPLDSAVSLTVGRGDRATNRGDRAANRGDRIKNDGDRAKSRGDRVKSDGDRSKGPARLKNDGDRVKGRGDRVKSDGDRAKSRGDRVKSDGDRSKGAGKVKSDGDRTKSRGDRSRDE